MDEVLVALATWGYAHSSGPCLGEVPSNIRNLDGTGIGFGNGYNTGGGVGKATGEGHGSGFGCNGGSFRFGVIGEDGEGYGELFSTNDDLGDGGSSALGRGLRDGRGVWEAVYALALIGDLSQLPVGLGLELSTEIEAVTLDAARELGLRTLLTVLLRRRSQDR